MASSLHPANQRRSVNALQEIENPSLKHLSNLGLKPCGEDEKGHLIYQIKGCQNRYHAYRKGGQIKWESSHGATVDDLEAVIRFSIDHERSLLINAGVHSRKKKDTDCDHPQLGHISLLLAMAIKINERQDVFKIAMHAVSQACPPLTHKEYPQIDIIDADCFSREEDIERYSLASLVNGRAKEVFRDRQVNMGADSATYIESTRKVSIHYHEKSPPKQALISTNSQEALIEKALGSFYQQHRYTLMRRLFEEQVELSFNEGFFAIEIAKKTKRKIGEDKPSRLNIDGERSIATMQGPVQSIIETTFISIDHLMAPQGTPVRHLILEGKGGTGKSTLLSYLVYLFNFNKTALGSWASPFKYVISIPLLEMHSKGYDSIAKYLKKEEPSIFEHVIEESIEQFIQENREQLLLLLDGYDEVAYTPFIENFRKWYFNEKYHLIITSRPGYLTSTNSASCMKLELEGFSKTSREEYIRFFLARDDKESIIPSLLRQMEANGTLASLGTIPLLLELITRYWEKKQKENIITVSSLCVRLVEGLFNRWQKKKANLPWRSRSFKDIIRDPALKEKLLFFSQAAWKASSFERRDLQYEDYQQFSPPLDILESGFLRPIGIQIEETDCEFIHSLLHDFFSALHVAIGLKDKTMKEPFTSLILKRLEPSIYWLTVGILNQLEEKDILTTLFKDLLSAQDTYTAALSMRALEEVEECTNETALIHRFISSVKTHDVTDEEGSLLGDCHRIYMKKDVRSFLLNLSSHQNRFFSFAITGMEKALPQYAILAKQGNSQALFFMGSYYYRKELFEESFRYYFKAAEKNHLGSMTAVGFMYANGEGVTQDKKEAVKWYAKAAEQGHALAQNNLGWMYENGEGVTQDKKEAVKWYTKAAEQGDANAQFNLGVMYANGEGVSQDKKEAVKWYTKAAEQGHAHAQFNLGLMYANGEGVSQDREEAVKWYTKAAEQGNATAQFNLGVMYANGEGFSQDKEEAFKWYTKAAEQGDANAQCNLGVMYDNDEEVSQDKAEAVKWFAKAAEQGYATAQFNLGVMYANGEGVSQDKKEAVKWYTKAAEQGHARAQWNLGVMYKKGDGVSQDKKEAVKWYTKAAEQGDASTQCALGVMYDNGEGVSQDKKEAVKWYTKAAEQGDASAQFILGVMYDNGEGVSQDKKEAVKWYTKAAEQGNATAQFNLGVMYDNGEGVSQDKKEAVKWYTKAAEQGDASAQFILGVMYDNGEGVSQDKKEAVKWYTKAAEQGNATAQFNLGVMYDNGEGVSQDKKEAVKWYTKAAEQGDASAQFILGVMYDNGEGVSQDKKEAVKWYTKAAEQGEVSAQWNLGVMYKKGDGVSQDKEEAVKWYTKAAEQGNATAQFNLGVMYANGEGFSQDKEEAFKWYTKAAEQGDASAQFILGVMYDNGEGVSQDKKEAVKWYTKAAEQGDASAQFILGVMYDNGEGVSQDKKEAVKWYTKAAEQGEVSAQWNLGVMYKKGDGVSQDKEEAVQWFTKAAEQGNATAQFNLGVMYANGEGFSQDKAEAFKWYTKAAEQGDANAQCNLGVMYDNGEGVSQDKEEAFKWFAKAAEQGYATAQFNLGVMYDNGEGVSQDKKEAVKWFAKAAEQGYATAQFNLGVMYDNGDGVSQDEKEAVKWYTKAAEQGDGSAQFNLGVMYANGKGVSQDKEEAVKWYTKAAEQEYALAQSNLGEILLARGDFSRAVSLFASAANKKSTDGLFQLGCCYELGQGVESDMNKATESYQKALEDGLLEKFKSKQLVYEDPSRLKILKRLMNEYGFSL